MELSAGSPEPDVLGRRRRAGEVDMEDHDTQTSPQALARTGGALYLIIIVIGFLGEVFVRGRLVVSGELGSNLGDRMGAILERQNKPSPAAVNSSLERIQGPLRQYLNELKAKAKLGE